MRIGDRQFWIDAIPILIGVLDCLSVPLAAMRRASSRFEQVYKLPTLYPSVSWPHYFLLCHAIELALKAYLAKVGATREQLKHEFGQKLDKLLDEAVGWVCV